jgi:para-nitrobenzyl esterase
MRAYGDDADKAMAAYPIAKAPSPAAAVGDAETDIRFSCYMDLARVGASGYAPVYGFEMNEANPAQQLPRQPVSLANTSYHTSDLAYLFDYETSGPLTGDAAKLGHTMRAYWIQFIKTGSPNGAGLPNWPQFHAATNTVLNLSNVGGLSSDFEARHNCPALKQVGLVYAGVK